MWELETLVNEVLEGEDLHILDRLNEREKEAAWKILLSLRDKGDYPADMGQLEKNIWNTTIRILRAGSSSALARILHR